MNSQGRYQVRTVKISHLVGVIPLQNKPKALCGSTYKPRRKSTQKFALGFLQVISELILSDNPENVWPTDRADWASNWQTQIIGG